ncbi:MAG: glycoside hydrolase family 3 N-terminal domain-containing protein [Pseudoxanthomonas sp.]
MGRGITRRGLLVGSGAAALAAQVSFGWALPEPRGRRPAFIDDLLARMTVEEKAGQLTLMGMARQSDAAAAANPAAGVQGAETQLAAAASGRLTGVFNGSDVHRHLQLQRAALSSRLKIPLLFAADVIHGFTTVFPVPLGEAASFDPDLARRTARAAAEEASAVGIDWTFAPMVDIARDARWGRGVEGAGEDVLLGRRMAEARVRGFQGEGLDHPDAVAACAKHFAAYGAAEAGLDYSTVDISERTLREVYFPPFQAAFGAGAPTTMAAFNEIAGIPATANPWLLDQVLRGEWGFEGVVVSDYTGDEELIKHGVAADGRDAARLAFLAGVDMSMQSGLYLQHLPSLVADGQVPMARLDQAVGRVLALKARLGLFDDPFRRLKPARAQVRQRTPATLALAREAARKSVVLLKNEGGLLPLPRSGKRIALIGPWARDTDNNAHGPWVLFGGDDANHDLAGAVRAVLGQDAALEVVQGCEPDRSTRDGVQAAVDAAARADVAVLAVGEPRGWSGEAQSRTELGIPAVQAGLVAAVAATGTPLVVVLCNGRALALDAAVLKAQSILVGWFLGSMSGPALADVLFGEVSPSGRLPVSFPRESGQAPYHYDHKPSGRPDPEPDRLSAFKTHYRTVPDSALFAFGHGLTYGNIEYLGVDLGDGRLPRDGVLKVAASVRNNGARAAEEVVQLYVRDRVASITRPVRELKDFRRVALAPGESATVQFELHAQDLRFVGRELKPVLEPGSFDLWVAPSAQADGAHASFEVV